MIQQTEAHPDAPTASSSESIRTSREASVPWTESIAQPDQSAVGAERLQELLPEINRLALRAGGLHNLSAIIASLERGQS